MSAEPATMPEPSANVSSIAGTLLASVPQVQEHAVAEHAAQQKLDALRDSSGALFDEAIHARDSAGNPLKTAGGQWAKRRGRKAGSVAAGPTKSAAGSTLGGTTGALAPASAQARAAGEGACSTFLTLCTLAGGPEWNPIIDEKLGIDEAAQQRKIWGDYFAAKNMQDIPPGVAFALGLASYAGPRLFMPVTKSRLAIAKEWISEKATKVYLWYFSRRGK